jgi:Tol biopolymer transport system component
LLFSKKAFNRQYQSHNSQFVTRIYLYNGLPRNLTKATKMNKILVVLSLLLISSGLKGQSDFSPSISPDGRLIAFYRYVEKVPQIFVISADGSDLLQLTTDSQLWSIGPNWSNDMSQLYFSHGESMASLDVTTLDLLTDDITRIEREGMQFALGEFNKSFLWASKGKGIEFYLSPNAKLESNELIEIDGFLKYWVYACSTGTFIVVNDEGKEGIYKKGNNGISRLIEMKGIKNFSVSTNGKNFVFESTANGASDIYIGDINGENVKNITHAEATDMMPSISPNADFVVFSSNRTGSFCLFKLYVNSNEIIQLTGN